MCCVELGIVEHEIVNAFKESKKRGYECPAKHQVNQSGYPFVEVEAVEPQTAEENGQDGRCCPAFHDLFVESECLHHVADGFEFVQLGTGHAHDVHGFKDS